MADSYVSASKPTTNYGTKTTMVVDGNPVAIAYLKFDLTSLAGRHIESAKLRLRTANDASAGIQSVNSVVNTSWTERGVTYNNRPALGTAMITFTSTTANTWVEIDITNYVIAAQGKLMSIGLSESSSDSLSIYSREASSNSPVLVIISTQGSSQSIPY